MRFRNRKGTAELTCDCGSWLEHWRSQAITTTAETLYDPLCAALTCSHKAEVGAHVNKTDELGRVVDQSVFIIPLCSKCNAATDTFEAKPGTKIVSANKAKTCEKYEVY